MRGKDALPGRYLGLRGTEWASRGRRVGRQIRHAKGVAERFWETAQFKPAMPFTGPRIDPRYRSPGGAQAFETWSSQRDASRRGVFDAAGRRRNSPGANRIGDQAAESLRTLLAGRPDSCSAARLGALRCSGGSWLRTRHLRLPRSNCGSTASAISIEATGIPAAGCGSYAFEPVDDLSDANSRVGLDEQVDVVGHNLGVPRLKHKEAYMPDRHIIQAGCNPAFLCRLKATVPCRRL
jgi:hypothetical protein